MKHVWARCGAVVTAALLVGALGTAEAQLTIPGADGSDGELNITSDVTIDLSLAPTGSWDSPGNGNGVYDPEKWAVVFKYTSVYLNEDVWFRRHPSGAPVVWLVSGDVNITSNDFISVSGYDSNGSNDLSLGGPGGFHGGHGELVTTSSGFPPGGGFGPGGGAPAIRATSGAGSYATAGSLESGPTYGNARILPLIGGSGGGGNTSNDRSGGGGGGAILIAAQGTITIDGAIYANGGDGAWNSGPGSGGAVRLIANVVTGNGIIEAQGGTENGSECSPICIGGMGRIRIETNNAGPLMTIPQTSLVPPDDPVQLWPPVTTPTVRVVSVGEVAAPADPIGIANLNTDITLNGASTANIVLQTTNVPSNASVTVRIVPRYGTPSTANASFTSGTTAQATWTASNVALPQGQQFAVQAHAVNP